MDRAAGRGGGSGRRRRASRGSRLPPAVRPPGRRPLRSRRPASPASGAGRPVRVGGPGAHRGPDAAAGEAALRALRRRHVGRPGRYRSRGGSSPHGDPRTPPAARRGRPPGAARGGRARPRAKDRSAGAHPRPPPHRDRGGGGSGDGAPRARARPPSCRTLVSRGRASRAGPARGSRHGPARPLGARPRRPRPSIPRRRRRVPVPHVPLRERGRGRRVPLRARAAGGRVVETASSRPRGAWGRQVCPRRALGRVGAHASVFPPCCRRPPRTRTTRRQRERRGCSSGSPWVPRSNASPPRRATRSRSWGDQPPSAEGPTRSSTSVFHSWQCGHLHSMSSAR